VVSGEVQSERGASADDEDKGGDGAEKRGEDGACVVRREAGGVSPVGGGDEGNKGRGEEGERDKAKIAKKIPAFAGMTIFA
jgi:hypothetical protein